MDGRRRALLSVPFGYASLHCEQGTPIPLANDLQLFNFRWQSLFKFGWQWTYNNIHILKNEYELLNEYIKSISDQDYSGATMIAMSNKTVNSLSNIIRPVLGFRSRTVSVGDLLLVTQNNMISGLMNGDLLKVVQVGQREYRACLTFVHVEVQSLDTNEVY